LWLWVFVFSTYIQSSGHPSQFVSSIQSSPHAMPCYTNVQSGVLPSSVPKTPKPDSYQSTVWTFIIRMQPRNPKEPAGSSPSFVPPTPFPSRVAIAQTIPPPPRTTPPIPIHNIPPLPRRAPPRIPTMPTHLTYTLTHAHATSAEARDVARIALGAGLLCPIAEDIRCRR